VRRHRKKTESDLLFVLSNVSARVKAINLNAWHHAIPQVRRDHASGLGRRYLPPHRDTIIIMEDIGDHEQVGGEGTAISRTVEVYRTLFGNHGFNYVMLSF
jgi:hypothetical protein